MADKVDATPKLSAPFLALKYMLGRQLTGIKKQYFVKNILKYK